MRRLTEFLNEQHSMGERRKQTYHDALKLFEKAAGAEFEDIFLDRKKVNDTLAALAKIPKNPSTVSAGRSFMRADSSWNSYLGVYKRYAKWLSDPDDMDCPKVWRKIKAKPVDWEEKLKDKWLTEDEFFKLLEAVDVLCIKALFCTAVAGALRVGEVLNCQVGDVAVSGSECKVTVSGKTGTRTFIMNQFAPVLIQWLNFHPLKHDASAPLWTRSMIKKNLPLHRGLEAQQVNNLLRKYCGVAGIKKPVSMHWLRHTKVTWTAMNRKVAVTDKEANVMFGWSGRSDMYKKYTHLNATHVADTFRLLDGVELSAKGRDRGKILERRKCLGCNEYNIAGSLYCFKCGLPLTEEEAQRQKLLRELTDEALKSKLNYRKAKKKIKR